MNFKDWLKEIEEAALAFGNNEKKVDLRTRNNE